MMQPLLKWAIAFVMYFCLNSSWFSVGGTACGNGNFQCFDGKCINRKWRCDGANDCSDGSDEKSCKCTRYDRYSKCSCPVDYFQCSLDCIPKSWTCDGVQDCKDGTDESFKLCVKIRPCTVNEFECGNKKCVNSTTLCDGTNDCGDYSDENCYRSLGKVSGLKGKLSNITAYFDGIKTKNMWGEETPRAFLALYFADNQLLYPNNTNTKMILKHLDLLIALALLRNDTDVLTPTKMAIYIQSLIATCLNPRYFHGFDLLKQLAYQVKNLTASQLSPTVILALCNADQTIGKALLQSIRWHMNSTAENAMQLDMKAQSLIALECLKKKGVDHNVEDSNVQKTIEEIKARQMSDGSFVNLYTTALVVQAMVAIKDNGENWNFTRAVNYLLSKQNINGSFDGNIVTTYAVAPILAGKTFLDIPRPNCEERLPHEKESLEKKFHIKYSLWIGDHKDVAHTIGLRVTAEDTIFDVLSSAGEENPIFKMEHVPYMDSVYIYSINHIHNDPENMMYWRLYQARNRTLHKVTQNIKVALPQAEDHFIMWYSSGTVW